MKLFLVAFALIASAAADVSHLNREYLPPVQHDHSSGSGSSSSHYGAVGDGGSASAGLSDSVSYSSQQHNHDYGHGQQSQAVHISYGSAPAPAPGPAPAPAAAAPAEDAEAVSYGSYSQDAVAQQYQGAVEEQQQQVNVDVSGAAGAAGATYSGTYDLRSQDDGVQDFGQNSLLTDSYGNDVGAHESHVGLAAAQGPAIHAPQTASYSNSVSQDAVQQYVSAGADVDASSGVETQYGSNGGYIY